MTQKNKNIIIILIVVLSFIGFLTLRPIEQNLAYHQFVDTRAYFGIPNFWDVFSNIGFLIVGIIGLINILIRKPEHTYWSWITFYVGVILVCPGSAYYHWNPNNSTLVWDRLPMTVGFMGLFTALLCMYISNKLEKFVLIPALLFGFFSVFYWDYTGDLRIYYWVQFIPLALIPIMALLYRKNEVKGKYLLIALVFYIAAKIVEHRDPQIFHVTHDWMSGHTLKHWLAAVAPLFLLKLASKDRCSKVSVSQY